MIDDYFITTLESHLLEGLVHHHHSDQYEEFI